MDYKYLEFLKVATLPRTNVYDVFPKSCESKYGRDFKLGQIRWYGRWRQYAFFPCSGTAWNKGCLAEVRRFLEEIKL
jgi:hypothetical protein